MSRILFWGLFGLTLAIYAAMLGWSLPSVAAAAGGLVPFDMRPGGYGFADAHAFLAALSTEGAEFYVNVQQKLDIAYPGLLTLTLFFAIAALLPRRIAASRWIVAAIALPVGAFDYLENHAVAQMIEAGVSGLTTELVATASQWTVLKSGASTIAMSIVLILLLWRAAQKLIPWLKTMMVRRPVASFIVLGLALSALVQAVAIKALGLGMFPASSAGVLLGLGVPVVLVTAASTGRAGLRDLASRLAHLRGTIPWLLLSAFGLVAAMALVAAPFDGGAPLVRLATDWTGLVTSYLPELLLTFVFIQLVEELAWTGFLQHRLQPRHGAFRAALLVAPVFGLSHLMLNYLGSGDVLASLAMVGVQIVFALFFRVLIGFFYNRSGQAVAVAALFHAAFNTVNGHYMSEIVGANFAGWLPLVLVAIAAIGVAAATRGRLGFGGTAGLEPAGALQPA